jgi:hypothetical protein
MTAQKYRTFSVEDLVTEFGNVCIAQYDADAREEIALYNRLYKRMQFILDELKIRPGDQRRALQIFLGHGNLQLRYMAAHANLAIDYQKSRNELEAIKATNWMPQAANAAMTLDYLDNGFYRPT